MTSSRLVLAATDAEDLETVSARLQDAVAMVRDLVYLPKSRRFAALFNRFKWESADANSGARVRTGLLIDGVLSAKSNKLKTDEPEGIASLLAIRFQPKGAEDPGGTMEFVFSGGGTLRLEVECIQLELSDVSGEWAALGRPNHETEA
ncbi:MAG TPA: DUF2948 family protein [Rhizomicrobium sp.]|jgi:hypothetical protein|nr:DUF2948 family protein [Rhizomicrobium sp.]